ncbi:major facilitator superfamily domain-containing protein [Zopfochytrium polystomum]|nr:major facilitator superfamily domain-containing protein [Zopfochytrium polystomum]
MATIVQHHASVDGDGDRNDYAAAHAPVRRRGSLLQASPAAAPPAATLAVRPTATAAVAVAGNQSNPTQSARTVSSSSSSSTTTSASPSRCFPSLRPNPTLVLPLLFFHVLSTTMGQYPFNQFLILVVCEQLAPGGSNTSVIAAGGQLSSMWEHQHFMGVQSVLGVTPDASHASNNTATLPDYDSCSVRPDVQALSSMWSQIINLATSVPAFLIAPVVGYYVDRLGRRLVMLVPIFFCLVNITVVISVARFQASLWLLVLAHLAQGIAGGSTVLVTCTYAYLADTTTSTGRTEKFLLTDAVTFTAFSLGPFVGGLIYKTYSIEAVFYIAGIFELAVLAYVVFVLPESLRKRKHEIALRSESSPALDSQAGSTSASTDTVSPDNHVVDEVVANRKLREGGMWNLIVQSWINVATVLVPPGRGRSVLVLASVMAVAQTVFGGFQIVFFAYPAFRFGWDAFDSGLFSLLNSIIRLFYLTLLLPILLRVFSAGKGAVEKIRLELAVIRTGMFAYTLGFLSFGLATAKWMFYVIAAADGFGVVALPTVRALLSRTVPNAAQGRLFSALEMIQAGSLLTSQLVLPWIYRSTLHTLPQAICFVISAIWAVSLSITMWLKSRELVSLTEEEDRFGEDDGEATGGDLEGGTAGRRASIDGESDPMLANDVQRLLDTREVEAFGAELVNDAAQEQQQI